MIHKKRLPPITAGDNPFLHDAYNMGHHLGTNVVLMYANHPSEECKYFVVVEMNTGERTLITFDKKEV